MSVCYLGVARNIFGIKGLNLMHKHFEVALFSASESVNSRWLHKQSDDLW